MSAFISKCQSWPASVAVFVLCFLAAVLAQANPTEADEPVVDTALVIAIDVSDSVDASRYKLQMEGVARALEDRAVVDVITSGPSGAILLTLVAWSDSAEVAIPWRTIRNFDDATQFAAEVRKLPQRVGEFTCAGRMFEFLKETVVTNLPVTSRRVVVDVSGDGIDNCVRRTAVDSARDDLLNLGTTINGLPIIVKGENDTVGAGAYRAPGYGLDNLSPDSDMTTLDVWYRDHVIGGPGSFLLTAHGFDDFGRAFRQKFVTEISDASR